MNSLFNQAFTKAHGKHIALLKMHEEITERYLVRDIIDYYERHHGHPLNPRGQK